MKVHEYRARALFVQYHLPVNKSILCQTVDEAVSAYQSLGSERAVVKAQVHTGGHEKAGSVKVARGEEQLREYVSQILGMDVKSFTIDRILVGEATDTASEYYVSIVIDRKVKSAISMLGREGSMDIESVAKNTPERIHKIPINPLIDILDYLAKEAAFCLFNDRALVSQAIPVFQNLYRLSKEKGASLAEIDPSVVTKSEKVKAVDAKMTLDDSALCRHPDVFELLEPTAEERKEQNTEDKGFSCVDLGSEIGYMINGTGLAMAAMDMIKLRGGSPTNSLDTGGSSNPTKTAETMRLLLSDNHVRMVLINIFGSITRCDGVAKGLIEALKTLDTDVPVVIRLTDINEAEDRELLKGIKLHVARTMSRAGKKAAELIQQCMNK